MSPDQREQMRQLKEHVRALRIDLSAMLHADADQGTIERAIWHLDHIVKLAEETIRPDRPDYLPHEEHDHNP